MCISEQKVDLPLFLPVWPDGKIICSIFGHLRQWRKFVAKNTICVYKSRLNILPNNPSKIAQRLLNCCQSGEISPNLVTLLPSLPPHFVCFCFASRTGLSILHFKRFHFEKENTRYRCYYYDLYYFFYFFFSPFVISSIGPPQPVWPDLAKFCHLASL